VTCRYTAGLWHRLMRGLGYQRYGAQGSDFGSAVTTFMALDDPAPMLGIHLSNLDVTPYTGQGHGAVGGGTRLPGAVPAVA
jgi:hypothetical protein